MLSLDYDLKFNGEIVGVRFKDGVGDIFDISMDDLNLIRNDLDETIFTNIKGNIHLAEQGDKLFPINAPNVPEITYAQYAVRRGASHMKGTDTELKMLYNEYNAKCFDNQLPKKVKVNWSNRMTAGAGVCRYTQSYGKGVYTITLSVPYHEKFPDQVVDTLVHEMIHVKHIKDGHGRLFKSEMARINRDFGFNINVYADERATEKKVNFIYACQDCGYEYKRVRRHKTDHATSRCGGCKGKIYLKHNYLEDEDARDKEFWGAGTDW